MALNEKHYIIGFIIATIAIIIYLLVGGSIEQGSVFGMLGGLFFNLSVFLGTVFGLQYYQLGTGRDIQSEIFDEKNLAAALYQGALFIAIALVIGKGL